jgi:hypothetical protein
MSHTDGYNDAQRATYEALHLGELETDDPLDYVDALADGILAGPPPGPLTVRLDETIDYLEHCREALLLLRRRAEAIGELDAAVMVSEVREVLAVTVGSISDARRLIAGVR